MNQAEIVEKKMKKLLTKINKVNNSRIRYDTNAAV